MKLPEIAIKNRSFIFVLVLLGLLIGINALITMPRSEDPNTDFPIYTIVVVYPGTGPQDMEELVVDPLEEALDEIDEIVEINSEIRDGLAIINVEAEFGIDYDHKYDEVLAEVNAVKPDLPSEIFSIEVNQFAPAEQTIIQQYALVSEDASYAKLRDLAEDLEKALERVPGINQAELHAIPEEEVRISLDFQKMAQQNISIQQVVGVLSGNNANIPGGDIKSGSRSFTLRTTGGYQELSQIEQTVIAAHERSLVYLKDIASVALDYEDHRWLGRFNGKRAVFVTVTQQEGENIMRLDKGLQQTVAQFETTLPTNITLASAFEQAPAVQNRISHFFSNLIQGILLVGLVIFLFLGFRPSLVIMTVIPLSIMMAIGALDFYGYALQQISIAALVIALGLLVDNGIVVMENIVRFRKKGLSLTQAAVKGASEVGYAIISSTVTTILAFAPLAFMQSGPGEYLRSLPVTVILVLSFSLVLALIFSPIMSISILSSSKTNVTGLADKGLRYVSQKIYRPALDWSLRKPVWVMAIAGVTFLGSIMLFPLVGVSFFPTADKPVLLIEIDTPEGSNLDATGKAVDFVSEILDTTAFVKNYAANIGHGNPQIYYNRLPEDYRKDHGQILINFKNWEPQEFYSTLSRLRRAFREYPGALITFRELKNGPPFEAPIEIKLIGEDLLELRKIARDVEQIISSTPGTWNVHNPLAINNTDIRVEVNRDKAGLLGLPLQTIDLTVRAGLAGLQVDEVTLNNGEEYPLVVRLPFDQEPSLDDFDKIYFTTQSGHQVPLKQVAAVQFEPAVSEILHYNLDRSTSVTSDVDHPDQTTAITLDIIDQLDQYNFPEGYRYQVGGEYENQQESFGDLGKLLLAALVGIFAVLVLQFRSLKQPLIVFSAIPLAISGSFVALFVTGWSFSFFAFVGFISLMGIVVNNSIILVDFANRLIAQGHTLSVALRQAAQTRLTPILLTTTTTIVGLLPLTLSQTGLWSPLGWTIIGGMLSSTLLTLFVVPVLYQWLTAKKVAQETTYPV